MKKKSLILLSLAIVSGVAAQEGPAPLSGEQRGEAFRLAFEEALKRADDMSVETAKERAQYRVFRERLLKLIQQKLEPMDEAERQQLLEKIATIESIQGKLKVFLEALELGDVEDLLSKYLTIGDMLKLIVIGKVPYGGYAVSGSQKMINFLQPRYDCLSGKTCSGKKVLLMNYALGIVVHEIMAQHKSLEVLGTLNNLRNIYIAAYPEMPMPEAKTADNLKEVSQVIWNYLKASGKCFVTGAGCSLQRRAAMYYMFGFWSAKTMHAINWDKLIKRISGRLPSVEDVAISTHGF